MPPRKRKSSPAAGGGDDLPPPSSSTSKQQKLSPARKKRRKKMAGDEGEESNGEDDRGRRCADSRFKPYAMINKSGQLVVLELDGKKGKEIRRVLKEAKQSTTIYAANEGEKGTIRRIVPFFSTAFAFSNFHPCKFQVGQRQFCCSEQFYHFCKAIAFGDEAAAEKLMENKKPAEMKKIGRRIDGFDEKIWQKISILVMVIGLMRKFQQNPQLGQELVATDGAELIEASPFDGRWGAKKSIKKIVDGETWTGRNLLGRTLMAVRALLLSTSVVNFSLIERQSAPPYEDKPIPDSAISQFATEQELLLAEALAREFDHFHQ